MIKKILIGIIAGALGACGGSIATASSSNHHKDVTSAVETIVTYQDATKCIVAIGHGNGETVAISCDWGH